MIEIDKQKIVVALIFLAMFILVVYSLVIGLEKQDKVECQKLLSQSKEFPLFYLTQNEKAQCDFLGVMIDAPVRYE